MTVRDWRRAAMCVCALMSGAVACDDEPTVVLGEVTQVTTLDAGQWDAAAPGMSMTLDAATSRDATIADASTRERSDDDGFFLDHECSEYEPVCGDNNMTYRNTCQALDAGVKVVKRGNC
jgi:hypothetical protein